MWKDILENTKQNHNVDIVEFQKTFPVAVGALATALKLSILFDETKDYGRFERTTATIHVNDSYSASENIFTIAHEIGHYLLHNSEVQHHAQDARYADLKEEKEANDFAINLLMPEDKFIDKFREIKETTKSANSSHTRVLADFFGVSEKAIALRAFSLGLVEAI